VTVLLGIRLIVMVASAAVALVSGLHAAGEEITLLVGFLAVHALLAVLVVTIRHRSTALSAFGVVVMLDGVGVQYAEHRLGPRLGVDLLLATFLASVCLVASYRTGVKLAVWQSLLIVLDDRAVQNGLLPPPADTDPQRILAELALLWLLVVVICIAAAINERELRRRRYDAEAMQDFSSQLHLDDGSDAVLRRLCGFLVDELDAGRLVVCGLRDGRLTVLQAHGPVSPAPVACTDSRSALLDLTDDPARPALVLRLDPARDAWLATLLPGARRLVALSLTDLETAPGEQAAVWAVFEHQGSSGSRVERRVITAAAQAAAIARLALSRAELFRRARISAATDGLTGVANRRTFDQRLAELAGPANMSGAALLLVDIDHFKAVNDTHGHQAGDQVLQSVAEALSRVTPPGATVARFGGEEFAILLPVGDLAAAAALGETARAGVAAGSRPVPVTVSVGVDAQPAGQVDAAALVAASDAGLYRAKQTGRNRVCLPPSPIPRQVAPPTGPATAPTTGPATAPTTGPATGPATGSPPRTTAG
jgi:diguanylate cyclase (GGDEF)-like protein